MTSLPRLTQWANRLMFRRRFLCGLAALFAVSPTLLAQQPAKMPRVGFLALEAPELGLEPFRDGLRRHGYVENRNIALEVRSAMGKPEREHLEKLANELVRSNVDIIVAGGSDSIRAAQRATKTIPIVMTQTSDPIGSGFVTNLGRPGGNTTGVYGPAGEMGAKRLQLVKDIVRGARRVAILTNPANPSHPPGIAVLEKTARALSLDLLIVEARVPQDLRAAFSAMAGASVDAFMVLPDGMLFNQRTEILQHVARTKLPAVWWRREFVEAGGLISYGTDNPGQYRQAADYVDRILKGANPGELPVEQPKKFEVFINLRTAKLLGVQIPQSVSVLADKVIQ